MGFKFSKIFSKFIPKKDVRISIIGLEASGKTSLLYQMKEGKFIKTIPTLGFNVEQIVFNNFRFNLWDIGVRSQISLWKKYNEYCDGIIFVIDSNDKESFQNVREALKLCLNDEQLKNAAFLIFANKQDLNDATPPNELINILEIEKIQNRKWFVQGSSAINGQGIKEGLDWLSKAILMK